ncbi:LacI family DNA-binding transcriptional regulator [Lacticaseibacillus saniviri]
MVGIREIAQRAGVSISTVSYALNGSSKITVETRDRILAIADELHYTPNLAGRTLKKQKTNIIGMYVNGFGGDFYSHVIDGVAQVLKTNHYELIVGSGGNRSRGFIPQKFVDGAIILDVNFPTEVIQEYADAGSKIVVMDRELAHANVKQVSLDNVQGARQAIDALAATNVKHFVLVTGPNDSPDSNVRMQTAISQVEQTTGQSVLVVPGDFTIAGGRKAAKAIIDTGMKNVGIFALNDELAIGLYEGFAEQQIIVGTDYKIIGFDNDLIGTYLTPQLTTVDYSKHEWGEKAAETLLAMINGKKTQDYLIHTRVISRGSLGEK